MEKYWNYFKWVLSIIFLIVFFMMISIGRYLPSIAFLLMSIGTLPLYAKFFKTTGIKILMNVLRVVLVFILLLAFIVFSFIDLANKPLYLTEETHRELLRIYDQKLQSWPVSFEEKIINTEYGEVYAMISGPVEAPPVLLLHAASMGSWSWQYNVDSLSRKYRTYAIDFIGEPGKCHLNDIKHLPMDGKMLSDLYTDITDKLGITEQYSIIAASFGGYVALSHAIHESGRVDKIVLLGPMGITPATSSVNTNLILYSLFPFRMFQDDMRHWALGDDPFVAQECDEWFDLVLNGVNRKGAPPITFLTEDLQKVQSPVLLVLGTKDQLVGNPEEVKPLANNVPDIRIKVLDSAHLIGMEKSDEVNALISQFLK